MEGTLVVSCPMVIIIIIVIIHHNPSIIITIFITINIVLISGEWSMLGMPGKRNSIVYESVGPEPYIDITFSINIRWPNHLSICRWIVKKKRGLSQWKLLGYSSGGGLYTTSSTWSFLKRLQCKQAADVILLLQPDRALCPDILHGPARLHPPAWCWRETHSRFSTLLFI